jgi:hypothetical protein
MKAFVKTSWGSLQLAFFLILFGLSTLFVGAGCHSLSNAEREMCQQSPQALCTGVVKAYKEQNLAAFGELSISYKQLKDMMSKVQVPASAKRESLSKLGAGGYQKMVQDSLQTILHQADIEWSKVNFEKFEPSRNPIEIATGYKMLLGKIYMKLGEMHYTQPITIVEAGKGKYFMGDFSPIEKAK